MLWNSSQALAFETGLVGPGGVIPGIQQLRPLSISWQLAPHFLEQTTSQQPWCVGPWDTTLSESQADLNLRCTQVFNQPCALYICVRSPHHPHHQSGVHSSVDADLSLSSPQRQGHTWLEQGEISDEGLGHLVPQPKPK